MQVLIILSFIAVASATSLYRDDPSTAVCELTPDKGTCRGYFIRYHFDQESGKCKPFVYGGCGGNDNNFESDQDCYQACGNHECPVNEAYTDCVVPCNSCRIRGKCNFLLCNSGCDCKKDHYRNSERVCVPVEECPSKK